ncbi:EF-P lysine aminoacylase EpmA [Marinomonas epiphytica]
MYQADQWQPTAELGSLKLRAQVFKTIRDFFERHDVLEVDTQCLSLASISDPHIEVLTSQVCHQGQEITYYLQTSPEFAMKRLLCAGSGSIYQLGKVFRAEEIGRRHSIEFTMLEWYRVGFDHWQLMTEIEHLLQAICDTPTLVCQRISYQQAFMQTVGLDPFLSSLKELQECAHQHTEYGLDETDRDTLLELIFASVVEQKIGQLQPCFVHSYPASQAALAKTSLDENGQHIAARFELYWQGMELANGYFELTDPEEQQARFLQDQQARAAMGRESRPQDERLVSALKSGMPECAGVALGVDRLLMLLSKHTHIEKVLPFAHQRA